MGTQQSASHFTNSTAALLFLVTCALAPTIACVEEYDTINEHSETGEPIQTSSPCKECGENTIWSCACIDPGPPLIWINNTTRYYCWSGQQEAIGLTCNDYCNNLDFAYEGVIDLLENHCVGSSTPSCTGWDPSAAVYYNTGSDTYEVDYDFVSGLTQDPERLWGCDDARVVRDTASGFHIEDAVSGDFLYELGLREGDTLISLNGYDLETYGDVLEMYTQLWIAEGETTYTLVIERSSNQIQLDYQLQTIY